MKKALLIFILLFIITGCSDNSSDPAPTEGTIVVENIMTSGNTIEQFGVAPVGGTVNNQLGDSVIYNDGNFTLYGVTDCNMDLDIRWVESTGYAGLISDAYLPCGGTGTVVIEDDTYSYK